MNQEKVWDNIAKDWSEFRTKPKEKATDFLKKQKGKILDLGAGSGRNLMKSKKLKFYEVDFSGKMLDLGKQRAKKKRINAEFVKANATKIPFKDAFFDAAIFIAALHCLETTKKRNKSVKELFRVLKPGAKAYVSVWDINCKRFSGGKKEKTMNWRGKGERYYYFYSEKEVHDLFKKTGFNIIATHNSERMINFIVEKPTQ